jgi:hypothetical protein
MSKLLFVLGSLLFYSSCYATNYYFSASGSNSNSGTSPGSPWLTTSKMADALNGGTINTGDSLFYRRTDTFPGSITITSSAPADIYIGAYGTGTKPVFLYSGSGPTADTRYIMWIKGVSYYTLENLNFTDTNHINDKKTPALAGFALYMGDTGSDSVYNCTIKYCDFSFVGMAVVFCGSYNVCTHCVMTDFKNLNGGGSPSDYGATALTIFGNDNEFSYNYVTGAWAQSLAFGFNGNVCELSGDCSRNKIMYNYCYDDDGVSEFGGNGSSEANDNVYVGNIIIDCGAFAYVTTSQVQLNNFMVYNNVQVESVNSRFSGSNCGHGLPDSAIIPINCDTRSFGYSTTPSASTIFDLRNNIFQFSNGLDVSQSGTGSKTSHTYNCYKLSNGSSSNVTLTDSEFNTSDTLFFSTIGNEAVWDYHLSENSPATGTGLTLVKYPNDKDGNPFNNNIGAFGSIQPNGTVIFPVRINLGSGVFKTYKNYQ